MKNIKDFDLKIEKHLKKLIELSKVEHSDKYFYTDVTYWDDGDFKIELIHNGMPIRYIYSYEKSNNEYRTEILKYEATHHWTPISNIKFDISDNIK